MGRKNCGQNRTDLNPHCRKNRKYYGNGTSSETGKIMYCGNSCRSFFHRDTPFLKIFSNFFAEKFRVFVLSIRKKYFYKTKIGGIFLNRTVSAVMSGAAAAAAVGTAVYMMNSRNSGVKRMRKSAAKTVKAVGSIANGISSIMR
jgi:hypothetical protein